MPKKILFLIPNDSMTDDQRQYYQTLYPEVEFASADPYDPMKIAREKLREGIEIIAGRGNTAVTIRNGMPDIHVVEIPITGYDIIRSLGHTNFSGKTIAVITNNADIIGLEMFEKLYQIRIFGYMRIPFSRLRETILEAVSRGTEYVVGGAITCKAARELGVPTRMVTLGPESMSRAMHEIRQIQEAIEIEAQRLGFIEQLINNITEGVISVDPDETVLTLNPNAGRMLGLLRSQVEGLSLSAALARIGLDVSVFRAADETGSVITVGAEQLVVTRVPVMTKGKSYGVIYTLHEPKQISSMEHSIRKAAYYSQRGYLARYRFSDIAGDSPAMQEAIRTGLSYAKTEANILLTGETGTGKELFAQSIHNASRRSKGAFVAVNCGALPPNLLESELFGYVEGAFTGATRKGKAGLFETAHGGTLFLDEISEMSYQSQASLLRVIQEKYVIRLGSLKIIPVDVRIIAATNRDLRRLVNEGKFREDLYYRINVLGITLPPLRERGSDAQQILLTLLNTAQSDYGVPFSIERSAAALLAAYRWPGNVREVRNLAERILATAQGPSVTRAQLLQLLDLSGVGTQKNTVAAVGFQHQRQIREITRALEQTDGNLGQAAALLGINRSTLWRRMNRLGLR